MCLTCCEVRIVVCVVQFVTGVKSEESVDRVCFIREGERCGCVDVRERVDNSGGLGLRDVVVTGIPDNEV